MHRVRGSTVLLSWQQGRYNQQGTRARTANTMISKHGKQAQGIQSTENKTKTDRMKLDTANRGATCGRQNAESMKGVSAPGNTCRPEALASNSAQERYT
jgi:hypothetical protein